jgi:hypothetical protein
MSYKNKVQSSMSIRELILFLGIIWERFYLEGLIHIFYGNFFLIL